MCPPISIVFAIGLCWLGFHYIVTWSRIEGEWPLDRDSKPCDLPKTGMAYSFTASGSPERRAIVFLLGATLLTSAIHFADNAFRLDLYPGPVWFNPTLVLMAWLVLPVLAFAAYRIGTRPPLIAYGLLGFAGFAHYLPLHVHRVPLRCLVTIAGEAIASTVLIAYVLLRETRHNPRHVS